MDTKLMNDIIDAIARLRDDAEKSERKREERAEIKKSYETSELKFYLSMKNMEQLGNLRRALEITGVGKLRKHELIDVLAAVITERLEYIIGYLFMEEVRLLEQVLAAGGRLEISDRRSAEALVWWGIAGVDPRHMAIIVVIPSELIEGIRRLIRKRALLQRIETMQQGYNIVKGMLFYYGVMELDMLPDIMERASYMIDIDELTDYIGLNSSCGKGINMQEFTISYQNVVIPARIYKEQNIRKLIYADISVKQALLVEKSVTAAWNIHDKALQKLLVGKYKQSIHDAENLVNKCIFYIKNDLKFGEIVNRMSKELDLANIAAAQELTGFLQNMYNHTASWILRGHSPEELSERERKEGIMSDKSASVVQKGIEKVVTRQVKQNALSGKLIGYYEVFHNDSQICYRTKNNAMIYIDERYCMKPDCKCNEAIISFLVVNESDDTGETVLAIRYKLNTGRYEVENQSCTDFVRKDILDAFKVVEKSLRAHLKSHYQEMKASGMKIFGEVANTSAAMPVKASPSVGRNDPCPCGSGKKYKKCCGR